MFLSLEKFLPCQMDIRYNWIEYHITFENVILCVQLTHVHKLLSRNNFNIFFGKSIKIIFFHTHLLTNENFNFEDLFLWEEWKRVEENACTCVIVAILLSIPFVFMFSLWVYESVVLLFSYYYYYKYWERKFVLFSCLKTVMRWFSQSKL